MNEETNRRRPLGNRMTNPDRDAAMKSLAERGQGLYTLIVLLVALVFWVAIKNTDIGTTLSNRWNSVTSCVGNPSGCSAAS